MVCYLKGRVVSIDECDSSDAIYVHRKCLEWYGPIFCADSIQLFKLIYII
jgi:BRCA1-associated RING domain protein 1